MAYVTSVSYDGSDEGKVQVLDVSDPSDIRTLSSITDSDALILGGAQFIFVEDGLAYVTSFFENGVQVLDVSDPGRLVPLGSITDNDNLTLDKARRVLLRMVWLTLQVKERMGSGFGCE